MHLIESTPRTYRHRGYEIEVVACGPFRWAVWRLGGDDCWHVRSLAEAREVISQDIEHREEARAAQRMADEAWRAEIEADSKALRGDERRQFLGISKAWWDSSTEEVH